MYLLRDLATPRAIGSGGHHGDLDSHRVGADLDLPQVETCVVREKLPQEFGVHSRLPVRGPAPVKEWATPMIPSSSPKLRENRNDAPNGPRDSLCRRRRMMARIKA